MAIAREVESLANPLKITFVSYGTGAETLRQFGVGVVDMHLPDANHLQDTIVRAGAILDKFRPRMVISHEEFIVPIVSQIFGIHNVFITDWFIEESDFSMQALNYADALLFLGRPGPFVEPSYLQGRVSYVGEVSRQLDVQTGDRCAVRAKFGFTDSHVIISVIPGAWANEERAPILELVSRMFDLLPRHPKALVWIAGRDADLVSKHFNGRPDVVVLESYWPTEKLMTASDVVITKGNRGTTEEAARLGIRSISLSRCLNPIDDLVVKTLANHKWLDVREHTPNTVAVSLETLLCAELQVVSAELQGSLGAVEAATLLNRHINCHVRRGRFASTIERILRRLL